VEEHVATRTSTQARSHAQKFFANIMRKNITMEQFLEQLDLAKLHAGEYAFEDFSDKGDEEKKHQATSDLQVKKYAEPKRRKGKTRVMHIAMTDALQPSQMKPALEEKTLFHPPSSVGGGLFDDLSLDHGAEIPHHSGPCLPLLAYSNLGACELETTPRQRDQSLQLFRTQRASMDFCPPQPAVDFAGRQRHGSSFDLNDMITPDCLGQLRH